MCIYAPAFSLPEFFISSGKLEIEILLSKVNIYKNAPDYPCIFNASTEDIISLSDSFIKNSTINPLHSLDYFNEVSALAFKCKEFIDKNYTKNIKIKSIADRLKTSNAVITRYFKKAYHLTPIQYLNELRSKEAVSLIMRDKLSITDATFSLGFNDQRQLYDNFKKTFKSAPSSLQK